MKITIANLKHSESLSEETNAYTATVLVDGMRAFDASNHGTGGPDMYHPIKGYTGPSESEINDWLKANTPAIEFHDMKLDNTLEMVVGDLIEEKLRDARLKRLLRTKILIIDDKDGEPALYTYKGKPTDQNLGSMRAAILGKKITGRLVNGGDEALLAEARALV
jgi:hypothetical protein